MVGLGLYIQITIEDSDEFKQLQARAAEQKSEDVPVRPSSPIVTALREHPREVLQAGGMILVIQVYYYIVTVFLVSFATEEGVPKSTALWIVLVSSAVTVVSIPIFALLSDKVGRKRVLVVAAIATTASAFPFVLLLGTGSVWLMLLAGLLPGVTLGGRSTGQWLPSTTRCFPQRCGTPGGPHWDTRSVRSSAAGSPH